MALLSQVSTSYPRVPRDLFFTQLGHIFRSGYRQFLSILPTEYDVLLHGY